MGGSNSKSESSQSERRTSTKSTDTDNVIRRLAIDQSAGIGWFYDAKYDCFVKELSLRIPFRTWRSEETPQCIVINTDKYQGKSVLDVMDINRELRLSMTLNMVPQGELSSLLTCPLTTNALTRILYYYYSEAEENIADKQDITKLNISNIVQNDNATHLVTGIKLGMIVVVVLEFSFQDESYFNTILKKICKQLTENTFNLAADEKSLLDRITSTKIFSNLPELCELTKLVDVYKQITEIKPNVSRHRLLEYILQPVRCFVSLNSEKKYEYSPLNSETINKIEQHLIQLSLITKSLKMSFSPEEKKSLENPLKDQFDRVQQQISNVKEAYESRIKEIHDLVYKMRSGASQEQTITEIQIDEYEELLRNKITVINDILRTLQEKVQLIENCNKNRIEYWNVKEIVQNNDYDLESIIKQLLKKSNQKHIFCFDDKLEKSNSSKWNDFYTDLINNRKSNPTREFVYADFSFCLCQLLQMKILLPKNVIEQQKDSQEESTLEATTWSSKRKRSDESNHSINNIINVLLLGESGVGKSTFINAIVNYLTFESLKEARSGQPIVLMPVSFLMTVGDQFEERIIRFGGEDSNEDHNHPGQSVTQHCRSYVFTIGTRTRIRLIDTPGMGDTRGLDQDDLNMQHILSFINNLSHLNAICILLKPNESRLNVVFRSYFSRLVGFLGENVRNNIIFCFTNTRGTFFAPGNTGPLLKKMLGSHSIKDIPFKKANTFSFDNESFRYLVARLNRIKFDDYQKEEYKQSWVTSVNESNRLLQYICNELKSYSQDEWQSIEHAQFQITQLIRPMLETIRNTMRNIILSSKTSSKSLIKLCPIPASRNSSVCIDCKRAELHVEFWIIPDDVHVLSNGCQKCDCASIQHIKLDYILEYEIQDNKRKQSLDEMARGLDQLRQMITDFVHIFKYVVSISKENDPILSALNRMIDEEKHICCRNEPHGLNSYLYGDLKKLRKEYEKTWTTSSSNQKSMTLQETYKIIKMLSENNTISKQLDAIKKTQEIYMNEHEKHVS